MIILLFIYNSDSLKLFVIIPVYNEVESIETILNRKYRIFEVPITFNPRDYTQGKKIKLHDAFEAVWALVKYRFVD